MARNVEIKARASDLAAIRQRLNALGAVRSADLTQTDTFFEVPGRRLKLREFGNGRGELISYVRDDQRGPKVSNYVVAEVSSPDALRGALTHALGIRGVVRKRRTLFLLGQTRIHLDEVEGLGTFVECEVVLQDRQPDAEGHRLAVELLQQLSISEADLVDCAYVDLL
jgi:predicted adenylyl cyclase CyaB